MLTIKKKKRSSIKKYNTKKSFNTIFYSDFYSWKSSISTCIALFLNKFPFFLPDTRTYTHVVHLYLEARFPKKILRETMIHHKKRCLLTQIENWKKKIEQTSIWVKTRLKCIFCEIWKMRFCPGFGVRRSDRLDQLFISFLAGDRNVESTSFKSMKIFLTDTIFEPGPSEHMHKYVRTWHTRIRPLTHSVNEAATT